MPRAEAGTPKTDRASPLSQDEAIKPQILNGWKEIATHLGRGERTVKRWEAERQLPVRRVPGGGRAAVYAYSDEVEDWLRSHRLPAETQEDAAQNVEESPLEEAEISKAVVSGMEVAARRTWSRPWRWAAAILVPVIAGTVFLAARRHPDWRASATDGSVSSSDRALARELYLKGRFEWSRRTPESLNRALDDFTQSIVHDPTDAAAYSGMADTYLLLREYSHMPSGEAYSRARAAAAKAVELDDSLAEAHRSLAFVDAWGSWDFAAAQKEFQKAVELNPRDPITHLWFATVFKWAGWHAVTEREFNLAQELDPSSPIILANKSIWLFENGEREAGLDLARQVAQAQPDFVAAHRYLALMYWYLRDYPAYLLETEKTATLQHDAVLTEVVAAARSGFHRDGERGLLEEQYGVQRKLYATGQISSEAFAVTCVRMGDRDQALSLLEDGLSHHRDGLGILTRPDLLALCRRPALPAPDRPPEPARSAGSAQRKVTPKFPAAFASVPRRHGFYEHFLLTPSKKSRLRPDLA